MRRPLSALAALSLITTISMNGQNFSQEAIPRDQGTVVAPSWGTSSESAIVIGAANFDRTIAFGGQSNLTGNFERYCNVANCNAASSVQLPNGALITAFAVDACDTSATHVVDFTLWRRSVTGTKTQIGGLGTTGTTQTPGCATFIQPLTTPEPVNNQQNSYVAEVVMTVSTGSEARFGAFRVHYRLQVSPPPGSATFTDVPTNHPFFQFIEALAASGITSGCSASPPQYCPDATLTRGQMAVFLARALGLHFPN